MTLLVLALLGGWWIWYAVRVDMERRAIRQRLVRYLGPVEGHDTGRVAPAAASDISARAASPSH